MLRMLWGFKTMRFLPCRLLWAKIFYERSTKRHRERKRRERERERERRREREAHLDN